MERPLDAFTLLEIGEENKNPKTHERVSRCKTLRIRYQRTKRKYIFLVRCTEKWSDPKGHIVSIKFDYTPSIGRDLSSKPYEIDARVQCSCPAHQYWGSAYISTTLDYMIDHKEKRFPFIRDPNLINTCCKHVLTVRETTLAAIRMKQLRSKYQDQLPGVSKDSQIRLTASGLEMGFEEFAVREMEASCEETPVSGCNQAVVDFLTRSGWSDQEIENFLIQLDEQSFEPSLESVGMIVTDDPLVLTDSGQGS